MSFSLSVTIQTGFIDFGVRRTFFSVIMLPTLTSEASGLLNDALVG